MRDDPEQTTSIHKEKGKWLEQEGMSTQWGGSIAMAQTLRNLIKVDDTFSQLITNIKNFF